MTLSSDDQQLLADLRQLDLVFATKDCWIKHTLAKRDGNNVLCHCIAGGIIRVVVNPTDPKDYNVMLLLEPRAQRMRRALGFDTTSEMLNYNDFGLAKFTSVKRKIYDAIRKLAPTKKGRKPKVTPVTSTPTCASSS